MGEAEVREAMIYCVVGKALGRMGSCWHSFGRVRIHLKVR